MERTKQHSRKSYEEFLRTTDFFTINQDTYLERGNEVAKNWIKSPNRVNKALFSKLHTYDEAVALMDFKPIPEAMQNTIFGNFQERVGYDLWENSLMAQSPSLRMSGYFYMARKEEDYSYLAYVFKELWQFDWPSTAYTAKHHFLLRNWVDNKILKKYYFGFNPSGMPKGIDEIMFELWIEFKQETFGYPKLDNRGAPIGLEQYQEQWRNQNVRRKMFSLVEAYSVRRVRNAFYEGYSDAQTDKDKMAMQFPPTLPYLLQEVTLKLKKRARQSKLDDWQLKIFQVLLMTVSELFKSEIDYIIPVPISYTEKRTLQSIKKDGMNIARTIYYFSRWLYGRNPEDLRPRPAIKAYSDYVEYFRISQALGNIWDFNEYVYLNMFHKLTYDEKKQTFFEAKH